jgi:hypothetical protein
MAKDGTARGGPRFGQGRPSKAIKEKIDTGNPGGRKLKVMEVPGAESLENDATDLHGEDMPKPKDYMTRHQRNGKDFCAEQVFNETWKWLTERGCEKLVNPQLVSQYAMSVARWVQCEEAISEYGFIAKHPTSGSPIASPYVSMSQNYMKQTNQIWYQIFQIVRENCLTDYEEDTPQDNVMELLLRARKGGG